MAKDFTGRLLGRVRLGLLFLLLFLLLVLGLALRLLLGLLFLGLLLLLLLVLGLLVLVLLVLALLFLLLVVLVLLLVLILLVLLGGVLGQEVPDQEKVVVGGEAVVEGGVDEGAVRVLPGLENGVVEGEGVGGQTVNGLAVFGRDLLDRG